MCRIEVRVDREGALDFDKRPLLQSRVVGSDVEQLLSVGAAELRVCCGKSGSGRNGPFEKVDGLRDGLRAFAAGIESAAQVEVVGLRIGRRC